MRILRLLGSATLVAVLSYTVGCCCPCGYLPTDGGFAVAREAREMNAPPVVATGVMAQ